MAHADFWGVDDAQKATHGYSQKVAPITIPPADISQDETLWIVGIALIG